MSRRLTNQDLETAINELSRRDPDLCTVIERFGKPRVRRRPGGYATLVLLILEQQVSLASARATHARLAAAAGDLTPEQVVRLSDEAFRAAGVSRQKTRYIRHLGESILDQSLRIERLPRMDDDEVRSELTRITGIGPWTADVYLLMCLMRPDVWPVGDIALQAAARDVKRLQQRPDTEELARLGESWRPWRSVAARILWHHYLNTARSERGR